MLLAVRAPDLEGRSAHLIRIGVTGECQRLFRQSGLLGCLAHPSHFVVLTQAVQPRSGASYFHSVGTLEYVNMKGLSSQEGQLLGTFGTLHAI